MNLGDQFIYWTTRLDWMVVFGGILIAGAIFIFRKMAANRSSKFDFAEMFEGEDRRTSMAKFLAFIGGLTSTWIVVALAVGGKLSEGMFGIYLITLVTGKVASEYVAAKKVEAKDKVNAGVVDQPAAPDAQMDLTMSVNTAGSPPNPKRAAVGRRPLGKV